VAVGASDLVSFVEFDHQARVVFQSKPLKNEMILEIVKTYTFSSGGTAFHTAFQQAVDILCGSSDLPVLIMFLTDGCDGGNRSSLQLATNQLSQDENVSMKAIGFGVGADVDNLKRIAEMFDGRGDFISAVDEVQLVGSFEAAAAELAHTGRQR